MKIKNFSKILATSLIIVATAFVLVYLSGENNNNLQISTFSLGLIIGLGVSAIAFSTYRMVEIKRIEEKLKTLLVHQYHNLDVRLSKIEGDCASKDEAE